MHVIERLEERRQRAVAQRLLWQPIRDPAFLALRQRELGEPAQATLLHAFRGRIHGRQRLGQLLAVADDDAVLGMHDLEAERAASDVAEAAHAHAARERGLLARREMKESQREKARTVRKAREQLPLAAEHDLGQLDLSFHHRAIARPQRADRHDTRAILVAQRQQEQQILNREDAELRQLVGQRIADTLERGDRPAFGACDRAHGLRSSTHSISTCAPRGSDTTPTAARAGYGSRKYCAMI